MDLTGTFSTLEPSELPGLLSTLIGETLVRINSRGEFEPCLAASWQREADGRRWRISLRSNVKFHDGELLNAVSAAPVLLAALKRTYSDVAITPGGTTLVIQSASPLPDLLTELASPRTAIIRKSESSPLIGTGPFRVTAWEPGRRLALAAFEDYWGGRPFLDSAVINLGSNRTSADVFDVPFSSLRRILPEATRIWQSAPGELLALVAADVPAFAMQALALAIDRSSIVNVLTQRRGEPAFGLLPQWLSGYEFLFQSAPDVTRARQLASQSKLNPLALSYAGNDSFARAVAERIALNARDAGLTVQPSPNSGGSLRLVRLPLESADAAADLVILTRLLGLAERTNTVDVSKPETLYEAEKALLDSNRVIPLLHLPQLYALTPRVHFREADRGNPLILHLEDLWVDP
ncbi:MAG TPA: ABC transporter substrate-binding protein [Bryobacteraceae bacterium]|nr:ABC transporter substrate-binding protein [Bryobacteraceae bacterium]